MAAALMNRDPLHPKHGPVPVAPRIAATFCLARDDHIGRPQGRIARARKLLVPHQLQHRHA